MPAREGNAKNNWAAFYRQQAEEQLRAGMRKRIAHSGGEQLRVRGRRGHLDLLSRQMSAAESRSSEASVLAVVPAQPGQTVWELWDLLWEHEPVSHSSPAQCRRRSLAGPTTPIKSLNNIATLL
ncbi:hypothetical protein AOLI_G00142720 [Acnodon oligacanthus]